MCYTANKFGISIFKVCEKKDNEIRGVLCWMKIKVFEKIALWTTHLFSHSLIKMNLTGKLNYSYFLSVYRENGVQKGQFDDGVVCERILCPAPAALDDAKC